MHGSSTPLSDCISRYVEQGTPESYGHFLQVFLDSQLGVIVQGIPQGRSGQYVAGALGNRYWTVKGQVNFRSL